MKSLHRWTARSRQLRPHPRQQRRDGKLPPRRQTAAARVVRAVGKAQERSSRNRVQSQFPRASWPSHVRTGHGGGDFFTSYHFAEAIRTGEPTLSRRVPRHRHEHRRNPSLAFGTKRFGTNGSPRLPLRISAPKKYANDDWSPDPERKKKGQPPSSILGAIEPDAAAKKLASKVWAAQGYLGD